MKITKNHIITGILGVLVVLIVGGILIASLPPTNSAPLSNQSVNNPIEPKIFSHSASPPDYTLLIELPSIAGSMPIYQKNTRNRSEADIHNLAEKFGYTGKLSVRASQKGEIKYSSSQFDANNKDYIHWINESETRQDPKLLPSDSAAAIIADEFMISHGPFPGAKRGSISHEKGETCDSRTKPQTCKVVSERISIPYHHIVDGYDFLPDSANIEIGENGNVIRFASRWNSYEKTENVTIMSPQEAIRELQNMGINLLSDDVVSGKANITEFDVRYGYEDQSIWTDTVVPLYYFKGDIRGSNGTIGWDKYVPAIKTT